MDPEIVPNIESHIWLKINKKDLDPKLNIFPHHLTMSRTRLTRRRQTPWRRRLLSKFQWPWWKKDEAGTVEPLTQRRVSVLDSPTGDLGPGDTVKKKLFWPTKWKLLVLWKKVCVTYTKSDMKLIETCYWSSYEKHLYGWEKHDQSKQNIYSRPKDQEMSRGIWLETTKNCSFQLSWDPSFEI